MASEVESAVGSGVAVLADDPHAHYRIDPHNYLVIEENGGYSVSYTPKEIPEDVVVEADPVDSCPKGIRRFRVGKYGMNTFDLVSVGTITIQNGFAYIAGMYINEEEPDRSNEFAYIPPFVITCPIQLPSDHLDEFAKEVAIKVHKDLKEQVAKYCLCTPPSILNIDLTRPHKLTQQNLCRRCGDKLYRGGFDNQLPIDVVMDGPDTNFPAKKLCGPRLRDRISELPDEIIVIVLSFLSVREAAATALVSSRWSDLWKHTPRLDFDSKILKLNTSGGAWDVEGCKYMQLVNSVIKSHKAPYLKKFTIYFYVDKSAKCAVTKWLQFLFTRRVESLELNFQCLKQKYKIVLQELLRESGICLQPRIGLIFLQSLERLCLKRLIVSGEDIKLFLSHCPLLMELVIHNAFLTSDVVVQGTALVLRDLDICWCTGEKSIKVSAPKLTWICYDEQSGKLSFGDVRKLKFVAFRVQSPEYVAQHFASAVSCFISQLQYLTLILYHPKEFLANGFPRIPNLKNLAIDDRGVYDYNYGLLPVTVLISASPRLQKFVLKNTGAHKDATSHNIQGIKKAKKFRHRNLEILEFHGSCGGISDHIIELVTCISTNCVAIRKIIIGGPLRVTSEIRVEVQARKYLKQQLQGKLPPSIQLQIFEPIE